MAQTWCELDQGPTIPTLPASGLPSETTISQRNKLLHCKHVGLLVLMRFVKVLCNTPIFYDHHLSSIISIDTVSWLPHQLRRWVYFENSKLFSPLWFCMKSAPLGVLIACALLGLKQIVCKDHWTFCIINMRYLNMRHPKSSVFPWFFITAEHAIFGETRGYWLLPRSRNTGKEWQRGFVPSMVFNATIQLNQMAANPLAAQFF